MSAIELEIVRNDSDIDEQDRPCHLTMDSFGGLSLCGLRHIDQGEKFHAGNTSEEKRQYCKANHQMCVVCLAEYERIRGFSYFERG